MYVRDAIVTSNRPSMFSYVTQAHQRRKQRLKLILKRFFAQNHFCNYCFLLPFSFVFNVELLLLSVELFPTSNSADIFETDI